MTILAASVTSVLTPGPEPISRPLYRSGWKVARIAALTYLVILIVMTFIETWLVYPAPSPDNGNWYPKSFQYEDISFTSADGTKLHGWFIPNPAARYALLYCHGNGEDISTSGEWAAELAKRLHAAVFLFDYRGYGLSEGSPNEAGCIADGTAAQLWLADRTHNPPDQVVLMGRSLGSAVAVALAAKNGARMLVLENSFPTMPDVAAIHYPWLPVRWVMKNRYDNLERIQHYHGPLLQSHGAEDKLIPIDMAKRLFDAAPSKTKLWLELPHLGHNSPPPNRFYVELATFLEHTGRPTGLPGAS